MRRLIFFTMAGCVTLSGTAFAVAQTYQATVQVSREYVAGIVGGVPDAGVRITLSFIGPGGTTNVLVYGDDTIRNRTQCDPLAVYGGVSPNQLSSMCPGKAAAEAFVQQVWGPLLKTSYDPDGRAEVSARIDEMSQRVDALNSSLTAAQSMLMKAIDAVPLMVVTDDAAYQLLLDRLRKDLAP